MCYYEVAKSKFKEGLMQGCAIVILALIGYGIKLQYFDSRPEIEDKAKSLLSSLGFKDIINSLNKYELSIASQLVDPSDIDVDFDDIAGLDYVVKSIKTNVILPLLTYRVLRKKSRFFQPPKGVLLYGPPGCGKTMIAKATAKEAKARFINLAIPTLTDKMYGESQKYASAVFTLAEKLQPCIVFVDEIDTFLRSRDRSDHEVTAMIKAQFMILWDGLSSRKDEFGVIVLGATNRPQDVDEAILRRMPSRFEIPRPEKEHREKILQLFLKEESVDDSVDLKKLAESTEGFSASDLKELCRNAVSTPLREKEAEIRRFASDNNFDGLIDVLGSLNNVTGKDFETALEQMKIGVTTKSKNCNI